MTDPFVGTALAVDGAVGAGAVGAAVLREAVAGGTLGAAVVAGAGEMGL